MNFFQYIKSVLSFDKSLDSFNDDIKKKIAEIRAYNNDWERRFYTLMSYQNSGMNLESENKLVDAAENYLKAIEYGKSSGIFKINNYYHSYERLVIVYRKLKMYDKEVDVILKALSEELSKADRLKMENRLEKAKILLSRYE